MKPNELKPGTVLTGADPHSHEVHWQDLRNGARELARAITPTRFRRLAKSGALAFSDTFLWPFKNALSREMIGLERVKNDRVLDPLLGYPEVRGSAWWGLGSLGHEIVRHYRPAVVVELGTHMGLSALAMGMALRDLGEGGRIYAVDTWQGDDQAGSYGDDVYQTFRDRVSQLGLDSVIVPLRMTFDEARERVPEPIDLLHIDGLHTWDAVSHDWESYGPKVRSGGLVMFHDVNTFYAEMKRFWRDLSRRHESHLVPYSHGLGVIRV